MLAQHNLPIAEVYAVTVDDADPYHIYIGTQDNAALFGPADSLSAVGRARGAGTPKDSRTRRAAVQRSRRQTSSGTGASAATDGFPISPTMNGLMSSSWISGKSVTN